MNARSRSDAAGEAGFTALEVIIATALLGAVLVGVLLSLGRATDTTHYAAERNRSLDQLRLMANHVAKDLRQGVEATSISASAITVKTYVDNSVQTVTWRVVSAGDGDRVERLVGSSPAATYVVDLTAPQIFSYFGEVDPRDVYRVRINLATRPDPRHPAVGIATEVELRNAS